MATLSVAEATQVFKAWFRRADGLARTDVLRQLQPRKDHGFGTSWHPMEAACTRSTHRLFVGSKELSHVNLHTEDSGLLLPVRPRSGGPSFYWLSPHPCSDTGTVLIEKLQFGIGWDFEPVFEALLDGVTNALVVDVGANMGGYTLWPAALGHRVLSIEAQTRRVRALRVSAEANGWLNARGAPACCHM